MCVSASWDESTSVRHSCIDATPLGDGQVSGLPITRAYSDATRLRNRSNSIASPRVAIHSGALALWYAVAGRSLSEQGVNLAQSALCRCDGLTHFRGF